MIRIFLDKTTKTVSFLSFCLLMILSIASSCKQDNKGAAQTETATPAEPTRAEVAAAPKEDYSKVIMDVAKKEYEPLARRILANKEQLSTVRTSKEAASELRDEREIKEQEARQAKTEADFVENMKMLDYLTEKENSKEMTKAQVADDRQTILKKLKDVEYHTTELEKSLAKEKN